MLRSKLYLLVSAFSVGREIRIDRDRASMDEMFKELTQLAQTMPKAYMSQVPSRQTIKGRPTREATPES